LRQNGVIHCKSFVIEGCHNVKCRHRGRCSTHFREVTIETKVSPDRSTRNFECFLYCVFLLSDDSIGIHRTSNVEEFVGYLKTLSGYQQYIQKNPHKPDPIEEVRAK
jgi:hypothetical protein